MGLPSSPSSILDNFNRANGTLSTGNWSGGFWGDGNISIFSNQITGASGAWGGAWWNASTFGPDCEAYWTIATLPSSGDWCNIHLRITGTPTTNPSGYFLRVYGNGTAGLYRLATGSSTLLGATFTLTSFAAGSAVGISAIGSTLTAYHKPPAGSWAAVTTRTDSTYTAAGFIAIEQFNNTIRCDDLGGGTLSSAPQTITLTATQGGTVSILKKPNRLLTPTITKAASILKRPNKIVANSSIVPTPLLTRHVRREIELIVAKTVHLLRTPHKINSISSVLTANFDKLASMLLTSIQNSSATHIKQAKAIHSANQTSSGSLIKLPAITRQANQTLTSNLTLTKVVTLLIQATLSATSSLIKLVDRAITSNATPSTSLAKLLSHTIAVTQNLAAILTTTKVRLLTITANLTSTSNLSRQIGKLLDPSQLSPLASVTKQAGRSFAVILTSSANLKKSLGRVIAAIQNTGTTLTRLPQKAIVAIGTVSSQLSKQISRIQSANLLLTGSVTKQVNRVFLVTQTLFASVNRLLVKLITLNATVVTNTTLFKDISMRVETATVAISTNLAKLVASSINATLSLLPYLQKTVNLTANSYQAVATSLATLRTKLLTLVANTTITASIKKDIARQLDAVLSLLPTISKQVGKSFTTAIGLIASFLAKLNTEQCPIICVVSQPPNIETSVTPLHIAATFAPTMPITATVQGTTPLLAQVQPQNIIANMAEVEHILGSITGTDTLIAVVYPEHITATVTKKEC